MTHRARRWAQLLSLVIGPCASLVNCAPREAPVREPEQGGLRAAAERTRVGRADGRPHATTGKPGDASTEPWSYVLPIDYGIRSDASGDGSFRAPRTHGEHNGLDLLAPLGTAALSACNGEARSGNTGSFGNWVQLVCPLPRKQAADGRTFVSLFYAHLQGAAVPEQWTRVRRGEVMGSVGKTGNASGATVEPHLHFEIIVAESEELARNETHSGLDQSDNPAAARFLERLTHDCLGPQKLASRSGKTQRARRLDPFLVLSCLAPDKPALVPVKPPLRVPGVKWSDRYTAAGFDVDVGPGKTESSALSRSAGPPLDYFVGTWDGEYQGTQAFATLRVFANAKFEVVVQSGPDRQCSARGALRLSRDGVILLAPNNGCEPADGLFRPQRLIKTDAERFAVADAGELHAVVRRATWTFEGPVWIFKRRSLSAGP